MRSLLCFSSLWRIAFGISATLVLSSLMCRAQLPGGDKNPGTLNAAMVKLFGANTNFICKSDAHVFDKNNKETTSMPMTVEMLAGNIRMEISFSEVKSVEISPELLGQFKSIGLDPLITVQLPDKKTQLQIYPAAKSYVETSLSKDEIEAVSKDYKVEKSKVGKETVDGHNCEKFNVTLTDDKGVQQKAVVWFAKDLKDFPVQVQITQDDNTLVMHFKDVKLGRPEASHFERPAGMKKFETMDELTTDAATRRMTTAVAK